MSNVSEVEEHEDAFPKFVPDFSDGKFSCYRCGQEFRLWFNGGELDRRVCCGLEYETEATGYQLIISEVADKK